MSAAANLAVARPRAQTEPPGWVRLLAEVRACTRCAAELPLGPRPVLQLHPGARLLIAGQAPGARVHASGVPFDDPSGERLRAWTGLAREVFHDPTRVAIVPMGLCYPGRGRAGDLPPRPQCAAAWRERLLAALPRVELTLAVGAHAQAWHLPWARGLTVGATVAAWRRGGPDLTGVASGKALRHSPSRRPDGLAGGPLRAVHSGMGAWERPGAIVPLPHPSPRNQGWLRRHPWFERDMLPLLRERVAELVR